MLSAEGDFSIEVLTGENFFTGTIGPQKQDNAPCRVLRATRIMPGENRYLPISRGEALDVELLGGKRSFSGEQP